MEERQAPNKILVIGNATVDQNVLADEVLPEQLGGAGPIVSISLARFGDDVTLLTHVGDDADFLKPVVEAGVKIVTIRAPAMLRFENRYLDPLRLQTREQRAFGIPPPFVFGEINKRFDLQSFDMIAFGPLTPDEISADDVQKISDLTGRVALDPQGMLRRIDVNGRVSPWGWAGERMPHGIAVVHLNQEEGELLLANDLGSAEPGSEGAGLAGSGSAGSGSDEIDPGDREKSAIRMLEMFQAGLLGLTFGEAGAVMCRRGDRPVSISVDRSMGLAIDPTGCGDIFFAGMIHGVLRDNSLRHIGHHSCLAASLNATRRTLFVPAEDVIAPQLQRRLAAH